ncbi:hypothetical protein K501DRAFT_312328 [Backusella circina FSU 941]|nr:hypothetical protein K501DRAFT_312328 [Backusella circina FSU 941]
MLIINYTLSGKSTLATESIILNVMDIMKHIKNESNRFYIKISNRWIARWKWTARKFSEDNDLILLVVFGAGMFGKDQVKFKGLQSGVTGILRGTLKKRENNTYSLIVATIDECRVYRVCNSCKNDTLKVPLIVKGYGVLKYGKCGIVWNRYINAAKNMLVIAQLI